MMEVDDMGLFDVLKDTIRSHVENTISNETDRVLQEKGEQLGSQLKDNVKSYLENAKDAPTTTEDGKKSIDSLISMMDHSEQLASEATKVDGNTEDLEKALREDVHNLGEATHTNVELVSKDDRPNSDNENEVL